MLLDTHYFRDPTEFEPLVTFEELKDDVEMGGYKIGKDRLATLAASTCIVVAAHHRDTNVGMIGHFSAIGESPDGQFNNRNEFDECLAVLPELGDDKGGLDIWVGGGAPLQENGSDSVAVDRRYACEKLAYTLKESGLQSSQCTVDWSARNRIIDVALDCNEGVLTVYNYENITPKLIASGLFAQFAAMHRQ